MAFLPLTGAAVAVVTDDETAVVILNEHDKGASKRNLAHPNPGDTPTSRRESQKNNAGTVFRKILSEMTNSSAMTNHVNFCSSISMCRR